MDGRIDGQINKRAPDRKESHSGVPPRAPKLESSSKDKVKICDEFTSKLTISSPPTVSPDKARTVSSIDSSIARASHSFDFRFVTSDDEVRQL
ncbi:hypothetical protein, partial [Endozoicomonas sp. SESOKO2]